MVQGRLWVSRYLKEVQRMFQGNFRDVFRKFQGGLKKVSSVFQEHFIKCFKGVSRIFCFAWISSQLPKQKEGLFFLV